MGYNRHIYKSHARRQYTLTKTKMFVGFVLSTIFSILLSPYFDRYLPLLYEETITALPKISVADANSFAKGVQIKEEAKEGRITEIDKRLKILSSK